MTAGLSHILLHLIPILLIMQNCRTTAADSWESKTEINVSIATANSTYGCLGSVHDCLISDEADLDLFADPYSRRILVGDPQGGVDRSVDPNQAYCQTRNVPYGVKACGNPRKPGKTTLNCGPYNRDCQG